MFSDIINNLYYAFGDVIELIGDVLGDGFTAIGTLSSGVFGNE